MEKGTMFKHDGEWRICDTPSLEQMFKEFGDKVFGPVKNRKAREAILRAEAQRAMNEYRDYDYNVLKLFSVMNEDHLEKFFEKMMPIFKLMDGTEQQCKKFCAYFYSMDFKDKHGKPVKGRLHNLAEQWIKHDYNPKINLAKAITYRNRRNRKS